MADAESLLERAPRAVRSRVWAQLEAWRWDQDPAHPHVVFQPPPGVDGGRKSQTLASAAAEIHFEPFRQVHQAPSLLAESAEVSTFLPL